MDQKLVNLMDAYWEDFAKKRDESFVVKPSIPIIWFGNMEAYRKSKRKIVTVAINPSNKEFMENTKIKSYSFCRFQGGEKLWEKDELTMFDKELLYSVLNNYFKVSPYTSWFNAFENPLNCLDSTYYPNKKYKSTAIHIDIESAIATDPTWGNLGDKQGRLRNTALFKQFLEYLNPDVILYSVNAPTLKKVFGLTKMDILDKYPAGRGIAINTYQYYGILIISGKNWSKPFQGMTKEMIANTMAEIKNKYLEEC